MLLQQKILLVLLLLLRVLLLLLLRAEVGLVVLFDGCLGTLSATYGVEVGSIVTVVDAKGSGQQ